MSQKQSCACCCGLCMARDPRPPLPCPPPAAPKVLNSAFHAWERQHACLMQSGSHFSPSENTWPKGRDAPLPRWLLGEWSLPSRCLEARIICRVDPNDLVRKHNISHHGKDRCDRIYLCLTQHEGDVVCFCCFSHRVTKHLVPRDVRAWESQGKSLSLSHDFASGTARAGWGVE